MVRLHEENCHIDPEHIFVSIEMILAGIFSYIKKKTNQKAFIAILNDENYIRMKNDRIYARVTGKHDDLTVFMPWNYNHLLIWLY